MEKLEHEYTLFMEDGTPVRATSKCTFKEYRDNPQRPGQQNRQSSDVAKHWVVKRGETVSSIAGEEYGDPALWRVIADHNDLDDPFRPRAGDGAAAASRDGVPVGKVARVTTRQGFDVAVPEVKLRVNGNDLSLDATSDIMLRCTCSKTSTRRACSR